MQAPICKTGPALSVAAWQVHCDTDESVLLEVSFGGEANDGFKMSNFEHIVLQELLSCDYQNIETFVWRRNSNF